LVGIVFFEGVEGSFCESGYFFEDFVFVGYFWFFDAECFFGFDGKGDGS
jgi:hypothetical protein